MLKVTRDPMSHSSDLVSPLSFFLLMLFPLLVQHDLLYFRNHHAYNRSYSTSPHATTYRKLLDRSSRSSILIVTPNLSVSFEPKITNFCVVQNIIQWKMQLAKNIFFDVRLNKYRKLVKFIKFITKTQN